MVFALDPDAQRLISLQFARQRVEKRYEAVLRGVPTRDAGEVSLPLRTDWPNRPKQIVDHEQGKAARTLWRVVGVEGVRTRVELTPLTGKTHQLRVHAASASDAGGIGCPIVGDTLYDAEHAAPRLMLHASFIRFADPDTLRRVAFESPCPF